MTEENVEWKILSWLNTQGYDVEMKVATALHAAGFQVVQSSFYSDPQTGSSREIDVVGRMSDMVGLLYIYPVVECKKSSKPWVVFTSEQTMYNRLRSFAIMTDRALNAVAKNIQRMIEFNWFRKDGRVGYGITEAFTSKGDETFKAGVAATKACIALLKNETDSSSHGFLSFFFPTVALDGHLFECYLGSDGHYIVEEIDSAFVLFPIELGNTIGAGIRIVTLKALDTYCKDLNSIYQSLRRELGGEIAELATSLGIPLKALRD